MVTRRILVTEVKDAGGNIRMIYGRYDAVALASRGDVIIKAEFRNFSMSEDDFVKYGKER